MKSERKPTGTTKCSICGKEVFKRGLISHIRLAHHKESNQIKQASMSGLSEKPLNKTKRTLKQADITLEALIITFGLAWVIYKIGKLATSPPEHLRESAKNLHTGNNRFKLDLK